MFLYFIFRLVPSDNYFPSTSSNIQWDTSEYSQQQQYVPESLLYTQQQQRHNQRLFHPNLVDSRNTPPSPTPQYFAGILKYPRKCFVIFF